MAIALVQSNGAVTASSATATMPTWGSTTKQGNLLVLVVKTGGSAAWSTTPTGWTNYSFSPFDFTAAATHDYGILWSIAAGADATPSPALSFAFSFPWVVYSYEFSFQFGWLGAAADAEVHSAASATAAITKASGSTATLAQASELAIAVAAHASAVTALTFTNSFVVNTPGTSDGRLWLGWKEVAATTALSTTANWTTSVANGVRIATFRTAPQARPTMKTVIRRTRSGA